MEAITLNPKSQTVNPKQFRVPASKGIHVSRLPVQVFLDRLDVKSYRVTYGSYRGNIEL